MVVNLAVVGAGMRGLRYAREAVRIGKGRVVAVAEPDPGRRRSFAAEFGVPEDGTFADWAELAAVDRQADAVVIATQDRMHAEPAVAFARLGYHILLEKPMAPEEADARAIVAAVRENKVILAVGHVMRYTPYTRAIRDVVDSGVLGQLASVQHLEPVGWWHQAHSFVRGAWRRADESGPMLLTKSCHDMDWLLHIVGLRPVRVSSFGNLLHFRPENRPENAGERCVDCAAEPTCPYSATRLYLGCLGDPSAEFWPLSAVTTDATPAGVTAALATGPYGRCVYTCDNDVVDHQVVNIEFEGGVTASFTMTAFTPMEHRRTRLFGSHGHLEGDGRTITVVDFRTGGERRIDAYAGGASMAGGHGGGDTGLTTAFLDAVATGDQGVLGCDPGEALDGHLLTWAAERARETGTVQAL
ncbi:Gfo/Idh/MocA family protein [Nonomuraea mangrovi]|uniref:Gfo/Idh/MocA family protein n=1 Tax=Nonomuraea mangrovi TaxID=2316207 RepID=A0ABW4TB27_9ACTN